ncbi:MAG: YncE family protein [Alistipes senegalensis]|nr:YncE family protein [Bacteroides cellulosilyticus]MCM1351517.1 YncE family protein [Alistipes senegalensis]
MEWEYGTPEEFAASGTGLFVVNEGNFQYGNASLTYYDPAAKQAENEVFFRANAQKLGDTAQSMTVRNGVGWIVVNHSHVVFAIDLATFRIVGHIEGFTSPRYIHFVSDAKAYVTQLWDNRIFVVDPRTFEITGHIVCPEMTTESGSTERMVQDGRYVYVSSWSYQNRIFKVDTATDTVVNELAVGIQPKSLVMDSRRKLWTMTDGGYEGSPYGHEAPMLCRIDPDTFVIERRFLFPFGENPSELQLDGSGDRLYWLDDEAVWTMDIEAETLPTQPLIEGTGTLYYGLTVDPASGEIYVADAIDYQQAGIVYRYSAQGALLDEFYAGVTPGAFCWK